MQYIKKMKAINLENIKKVSPAPGNYYLYDKNKKRIYIGWSKNLQHRLFALLYGRADYAQVKSKFILRKEAKFFLIKYVSIAVARKIEKKKKKNLKFNRL